MGRSEASGGLSGEVPAGVTPESPRRIAARRRPGVPRRGAPGQDSLGSSAPGPTFPAIRESRLSPERRGILALRVGLGLVWAANLVFIVAPANQFFPTFAATAGAYAPTSVDGGALAQFVAGQPM